MVIKTSHYKRKIIKELCFGNTLSAQQLSLLIERSLPITIKLLAELVDDGMIAENGYALSTGGRRPQMYSLSSKNFYVVSVAMDQMTTRMALVEIQDCKIEELKKYDLNLYHNSNDLSVLIKHLAHFIEQIPSDKKDKIIGIGIGMPGFVDVSKGINYSFLNNDGENIPGHIQAITGIPTFIDNDSSLIALAESKFGAAKNTGNAMVVNFGWGVGLGMILNGELFRGNNGFAGEFSHVHLYENNKLCGCGKSGCLETEASLLIIIEKAKEAIKQGRATLIRDIPADPEKAISAIINAALKGDQLSVDLLSGVAYNIGQGIAVLIHILNPKLIVISGIGASAGNLLLAPMQHAVNKNCIPMLANYTEVIVSPFSANAGLIGSVALVMEHYDKENYNTITYKKSA